jgi:hypothetical protein
MDQAALQMTEDISGKFESLVIGCAEAESGKDESALSEQREVTLVNVRASMAHLLESNISQVQELWECWRPDGDRKFEDSYLHRELQLRSETEPQETFTMRDMSIAEDAIPLLKQVRPAVLDCLHARLKRSLQRLSRSPESVPKVKKMDVDAFANNSCSNVEALLDATRRLLTRAFVLAEERYTEGLQRQDLEGDLAE